MRINILFACLMMFLLMVVLPTILLVVLKKHQRFLRVCTIILSIVYFIFLFVGTTAKVFIQGNEVVLYYNFSYEWFSMRFLPYSFAFRNIAVNLALFFPIGFIVYIFAKNRKFVKTIIFAFLLSILVEFYQFILPVGRTTELTDLLFNTLSGVISAGYCFLLQKIGLFVEK